jgi:hypothetical protein
VVNVFAIEIDHLVLSMISIETDGAVFFVHRLVKFLESLDMVFNEFFLRFLGWWLSRSVDTHVCQHPLSDRIVHNNGNKHTFHDLAKQAEAGTDLLESWPLLVQNKQKENQCICCNEEHVQVDYQDKRESENPTD